MRDLARLIDETQRTGMHLATETLRPSARGRRYKNSGIGVSVTDGPFIESKELIAGYVIVPAASLEEAARWDARYIDAVEADEVAQIFPRWNRVADWLKEAERFSTAA